MPLGREKSGKEALCCLKPPTDTHPAVCPAAWEAPFHTVTPAPGLPDIHTHTPRGEARLAAHRHWLAFCGRRFSGHAASPAAWGMPSYTVPPHPACRACIRTLQGESRLTAHRHRLALCDKRSSGHAASPAAWGVPFSPAVFRALLRIRQSRPRTVAPANQSPAQQKTGHTLGCVLSFMGSEGVMPWQNGSDRNISRYSGGTVRCNVPPDRHAAA